jgi:anaerobic selenocysteine-containing dehydrogenase
MNMDTEVRRDEVIHGKTPGGKPGSKYEKRSAPYNPCTHCGIDAYNRNGVVVKVEGTKENSHNDGTLCSKGNADTQYVYRDPISGYPGFKSLLCQVTRTE